MASADTALAFAATSSLAKARPARLIAVTASAIQIATTPVDPVEAALPLALTKGESDTDETDRQHHDPEQVDATQDHERDQGDDHQGD